MLTYQGSTPERFASILDPDRSGRFVRRLDAAADRLGGRRLWQVNFTEQGGGVAEMLHFLLGYLIGAGIIGAGIDARWVVIGGTRTSSRRPSASTTCSTAGPHGASPRPYVREADAYVSSRSACCWEGLDRET